MAKTATKAAPAKVERPPATVDDDPAVIEAARRLQAAKGEAADVRREHDQLRRNRRPRDEESRVRLEKMAGRLRELEDEIADAQAAESEAVADAHERLAAQRRTWARRWVSVLADDQALARVDERLDEARKALADRQEQYATAVHHLEQLRTSRDPDDVDRIVDAEREVERARRHVVLVRETVDELEHDRHEAARDAAATIEGQVADRQRTLARQLREALVKATEVLDEETELCRVVTEELSDSLGYRVTVPRRMLPESIHARHYENLRARLDQAVEVLDA